MGQQLIKISSDGTVTLCPEYQEVYKQLSELSQRAANTWLVAELKWITETVAKARPDQ